MQDNQTTLKNKKRVPYLFYSFMAVVILLFASVILMGLSVYLVYSVLELIIEIVSPYGYVKQSYNYKKYLHLHRTNPNDDDSDYMVR